MKLVEIFVATLSHLGYSTTMRSTSSYRSTSSLPKGFQPTTFEEEAGIGNHEVLADYNQIIQKLRYIVTLGTEDDMWDLYDFWCAMGEAPDSPLSKMCDESEEYNNLTAEMYSKFPAF